jgi:hypothetical protein
LLDDGSRWPVSRTNSEQFQSDRNDVRPTDRIVIPTATTNVNPTEVGIHVYLSRSSLKNMDADLHQHNVEAKSP